MSKKNKLHICTVFDEETKEMFYNHYKLMNAERLYPVFQYVKAGKFSHRHPRWKPDEVQCAMRNHYLDLVPAGEWLLVLDSDEILLTHGNRISDMIDYLEANDMDIGFVTEIKANGEQTGRPRLIRKREGLKYGGPNKKHDYIDFNGENYIDVTNTETAMDTPIFFFHVKYGLGFEFFHPDNVELSHPDWVIDEDNIPPAPEPEVSVGDTVSQDMIEDDTVKIMPDDVIDALQKDESALTMAYTKKRLDEINSKFSYIAKREEDTNE